MTTGFLTAGMVAFDAQTEVTITVGGDITITQAYHTVASNSGTTDTLNTITIDAGLLAAIGNAIPCVVLRAKVGHTITVAHDAAPSVGEIALSGGVNVDLVNEKIIVLWRSERSGVLVWSAEAFNAPSGSYVDTGSVQSIVGVKTMTSPILVTPTVQTSLTVDGLLASFNGSQEVTLQAGVRTTDATVTTIASIAVAASRGIIMHATVIGVKSDHTEGVGGDILYGARREAAGNITELAAATIRQFEDSLLSTPAISADVDTGSQTMRIRVAGVAGATWDFVVTYSYHFIASNA